MPSPDGDVFLSLSQSNVLGRRPDSDVQVLDPLVSGKHCRIEQRASGWVLIDLGSLNGTWINSVRVSGEQALHHLDEITVGSTLLVFSDLGEAMARVPLASPARLLAGKDRAADGGKEQTLILPRDAEPSSRGLGRELAERVAVHERLVAALTHVLVASPGPAFAQAALTGMLDLTDADGGALYLPAESPAPLLTERRRGVAESLVPDAALIAEALGTGQLGLRTRTGTSAYRVWQPVMTAAVPFVAHRRVRAIVWLERAGTADAVAWPLAECFSAVWARLLSD